MSVAHVASRFGTSSGFTALSIFASPPCWMRWMILPHRSVGVRRSAAESPQASTGVPVRLPHLTQRQPSDARTVPASGPHVHTSTSAALTSSSAVTLKHPVAVVAHAGRRPRRPLEPASAQLAHVHGHRFGVAPLRRRDVAFGGPGYGTHLVVVMLSSRSWLGPCPPRRRPDRPSAVYFRTNRVGTLNRRLSVLLRAGRQLLPNDENGPGPVVRFVGQGHAGHQHTHDLAHVRPLLVGLLQLNELDGHLVAPAFHGLYNCRGRPARESRSRRSSPGGWASRTLPPGPRVRRGPRSPFPGAT